MHSIQARHIFNIEYLADMVDSVAAFEFKNQWK